MPQTTQPGQQNGQARPDSDLDVYADVTRPQASVDELRDTNLGLGVYEDAEFWQQIRSYQKGVRLNAAFAPVIEDRAKRETEAGVGDQRWRTLMENGDPALVGDELHEHASTDPRSWVPTPWRMMQARTEASRGRDGRLLDNVFGRVVERVAKGGEEVKKALKDIGGAR